MPSTTCSAMSISFRHLAFDITFAYSPCSFEVQRYDFKSPYVEKGDTMKSVSNKVKPLELKPLP